MADGGHGSAFMLLAELDLSGGQVSAEMALAEMDTSAGSFSAGMALAEMDASAGQVSAEMALAEMDASAGQLSAEMALAEMDASAGQLSSTMALADLEAPKIGLVSSTMALVELDADFFGMATAIMALAELELVPKTPKLSDINNKIALIVDDIERTQADLRALIDSGTATAADYRNLQASHTGHREDIAECRAELDALDVTDGVLYDDAAAFIGVWQWERQLRTVLIELDGQLREALELLNELINGFAGALYVVKRGDTLQSVAAETLGAFTEWRRIADANGITPGPLTPGQILTIPERK